MLSRTHLAVVASTIGLGLGVVATAAFAANGAEQAVRDGNSEPAQIDLLEREGEELNRAIDEHRTDELSGRYRELYSEARELEAEPERNLLAAPGEPRLGELTDKVGELRDDVAKARGSDPASGDFGLVGGVSQATLDAIAACESGGDPTAVNAAGYYGKYQFDEGTWASVGGSGNPAEASEAEQDMRASMLYAQAGSSPWPVCGQ